MNDLVGKFNKNGLLALVFIVLDVLSMYFFQGSGSFIGVAAIAFFSFMAIRYTVKYIDVLW